MPPSDPMTTTLSTKGQVILPKPVRDQRNWPAGTRLIVEMTPEGVLLRQAPAFPSATLDAVAGSLRHDGPAVPPDAMEAAVLAEAARRHGRD